MVKLSSEISQQYALFCAFFIGKRGIHTYRATL